MNARTPMHPDDADDIARLRKPPHSIEAEQSVLGGLLLDCTAWDRVGDLLVEDSFYRFEHRAIYRAIGELVAMNKAADVVTVFERLRSRASNDDEFGGIAYLNELAQSVPSAHNVRRYAEIVFGRWRERQVIVIADAMATAAYSSPSLPHLVDRAVTDLLHLADAGQRDEPAEIGALLTTWIDELSEMHASGKTPAIPTGLIDIDNLTAGGVWPGELWAIGARPSMGKSALKNTVLRNMGGRHDVLDLSMEDGKRTLLQRHVAAAGRVNLRHLRNPIGAPDSMWSGVAAGVDSLKDLRIFVDDQAALTLMDVRRKIQQVKRRAPALAVVFVDYLQLMQGEAESRNRELGDIAHGLQAAAKDFDVGVVLLSQLSRKADERNGPPQMSDLRDSGDIEGAAHVIAMLYREHMRRPTEENKHYAELHFCKNKNGPTDTISLHFDGAHQIFSNWAGPRPFVRAGASAGRGME
jgi:replicative DNA helicase